MELNSSQESTVFEYENIASLIYRQNNSYKFNNFRQILKINPAIHESESHAQKFNSTFFPLKIIVLIR